jgi:hypothetical protein
VRSKGGERGGEGERERGVKVKRCIYKVHMSGRKDGKGKINPQKS